MKDQYHHGGLRTELLRLAADVIERDGAEQVSLRALARDAGVSHAAPRHHFATRGGLLTALAAEGFTLLSERLRAAGDTDFGEVGVAYVQFATDFPAHFDVMFRHDLLDETDPGLAAAQRQAFAVLLGGVEEMSHSGAVADAAAAVVAGWSLVHGLATLAAAGSLDTAHVRELLPEQDLPGIARRAAGMLYGSPGRQSHDESTSDQT